MQTAREDSPADSRWGAAEWLLLLVLAAVQFAHVLDFMIMMPLGPRYLRELAIGPQEFGFLVSAYAFSACLSGLLAASFIDRFDRKHSLLALCAGFTLATLCCGLAPGYLTLLLARCAAGAFGGVLGALTLTVVGDAFPERRRGHATGVIMSAFSVATIAGIPAGLSLAHHLGTGAPFAVLAGVSVLVLVLTALVLPPLRQHLLQGQSRLAASTWQVLLHPSHLRAYALMTCLVLGIFTIVPYLATYLVVNVGMPEQELSTMYLCGGLATLLTMSLFGKLADRYGKLRVFRIMALLTLVPILVVTNLSQTPLAVTILITTVFMVVSSGRSVPVMALITSDAQPAYRGSFMSVNASVQQAAAGLASLLAGALLTQPVKDGPLVGYSLAGILACVATVASVFLAGYVRPAAENVPVPAAGAEPSRMSA